MKKKVILLLLLVLVIAAIFFPVQQQKTVEIHSPFLTVYKQLIFAQNWENWRPDLHKAYLTDSTKIITKRDSASLTATYPAGKIQVSFHGNSFNIDENINGKKSSYEYLLVPGKLPTKTLLIASRKVSLFNKLFNPLSPDDFADTHIFDLKKFMETDSLYYGCVIFKTKVPFSNLVESKRTVLHNKKFAEAAIMLTELQQYIKTAGAKQMQPLIAQFLPKGTDSVEVNVGLFINKPVNAFHDIAYVRMPINGKLYASIFKGKFSDRSRIYNGMNRFFTDHLYQEAILPFETYLNNKLPVADNDQINVQINFTTF